MSANDARQVCDWARQEGWNPGLHDCEVAYSFDPKGFFGGFLDGKMIGSISAVNYQGKYGFLGLYIVTPEHRSRGYGLALWKHAKDYLINGVGVDCVGLNSVLANESLYEMSGFRTAYRINRYMCIVSRSAQREFPPIEDSDFPHVASYDAGVFQINRTSFLRDFIFKTEAITARVYVKDRLGGFAVARPCFEGYKIGPLFANDLEIAARLAESLFADLSEKTVFIEVPEPNHEALRLVTEYGMSPSFPTVRMYTSREYQQDVRYVYSITSGTFG